jgi:hypothetical protein
VRTHLYRRVRAAVGGGEVQVAGEIRFDTAAMLAFQQVTQIEFVAVTEKWSTIAPVYVEGVVTVRELL